MWSKLLRLRLRDVLVHPPFLLPPFLGHVFSQVFILSLVVTVRACLLLGHLPKMGNPMQVPRRDPHSANEHRQAHHHQAFNMRGVLETSNKDAMALPSTTDPLAKLSGLREALNKHCSAAFNLHVEKGPTAAQRVFGITELVGKIMVHLPVGSLRNAMFVCRHFHECIRPDAEHPLEGMQEALGLRFKRSIESMTDEETKYFTEAPCERESIFPRLEWLMNASIDSETKPHQISMPTLVVYPFYLHKVVQKPDADAIKIELALNPNDVYWGDPKGIFNHTGKATSRDPGLFTASRQDGTRRSWTDIKLFTMPFPVEVEITVDFRVHLGCAEHGTYAACMAPMCQLGTHGIQVSSLAYIRVFVGRLLRLCLFLAHSPVVHSEASYLG